MAERRARKLTNKETFYGHIRKTELKDPRLPGSPDRMVSSAV